MLNDSATREGATAGDTQTEEQLKAQQAADAAELREAEEAEREEKDNASKRHDPRAEMMKAVVASRHEKLRGDGIDPDTLEGADEGDGETKSEDELAAEAKAKEEADAKLKEEAERKAQIEKQTEEGATREPTVLKGDELENFEIEEVIDGQPRKTKLAEMVRRAQKDGSADYRLSKATEMLEDAKKVLADARGTKTGTEKTGTEGAVEETAAPDPKVEAIAKALIDKMLDGDAEAATKLLTEALASGKGRDATPDSEAIAAAVERRIEAKLEATTFEKDYSDLVGDKYLARMVDAEFSELIPRDEQGNALAMSPKDFGKALRTAGEKVRKWKESNGMKTATSTATSTATTTNQSREDRNARKAALDQTSSASARSTTTAEPVEESRSSVIANIAKARGQNLL